MPRPTASSTLSHPDPALHYGPLMTFQEIDGVMNKITECCDLQAHKVIDQAPWLAPENVAMLTRTTKNLGLVGDTWDTCLYSMYACCSRLNDSMTISNVICGEKFVIQGWGTSPDAAQQWTLMYILDTARQQGVL